VQRAICIDRVFDIRIQHTLHFALQVTESKHETKCLLAMREFLRLNALTEVGAMVKILYFSSKEKF
jgi:hypothetical protein